MLYSVTWIFVIFILIVILMMAGGQCSSKLSGLLPFAWAHITCSTSTPASTVPGLGLTAPALKMLQPGGGDHSSEHGGHWGCSEISRPLLLWGGWQTCIAPPAEVKWSCVLLWPSRTSSEEGLWGKEEGVAGKGGREGAGCAAGADPLRKGSESRSGPSWFSGLSQARRCQAPVPLPHLPQCRHSALV